METNSNFGLEEVKIPAPEYAKPTFAQYAKGFMAGIVTNVCAATLTALLTIWMGGFYNLMALIPALALIMPRAFLQRGKDIVTAIVCIVASFVIVPTFQLVLDFYDVYLESLDSEFGFYFAMGACVLFAACFGYADFNKGESKLMVTNKDRE